MKALVKKESYYGLLHIHNAKDLSQVSTGVKFYSEESPSISLIFTLEQTIAERLETLKLNASGVDIKLLHAAETSPHKLIEPMRICRASAYVRSRPERAEYRFRSRRGRLSFHRLLHFVWE